MSYESTISYIHSVKWRGSKPGLSRIRSLLKTMGNPEQKLRFVHVAGTNGKGSTCACLAAVLRQAGYKTGLYTSPYLIRFNERMQINDSPISDEELEQLTEEIRPIADAMEEHPTEFELITAIAMRYFADHGCDIVVLEVGMGGELDSTNVIDAPECSVITAMGLDHTRELGPDIASIARAKAGIIKKGCSVVSYGNEEKAEEVFRAAAAEQDAPYGRLDPEKISVKEYGTDCCRFSFDGLPEIRLPLLGAYQPCNASLSVMALRVLQKRGWRITDEDILAGLSHVSWPGRFEILRREPVFVLDGAHNPHGIAAAAKSLQTVFPGNAFVFLMGVMADKNLDDMLPPLLGLARSFVCVKPENPRAMTAEALAGAIRERGGKAVSCGSVEEGAERAITLAGKDGFVCALGSLYFSGDIRKAVQNPKNL